MVDSCPSDPPAPLANSTAGFVFGRVSPGGCGVAIAVAVAVVAAVAANVSRETMVVTIAAVTTLSDLWQKCHTFRAWQICFNLAALQRRSRRVAAFTISQNRDDFFLCSASVPLYNLVKVYRLETPTTTKRQCSRGNRQMEKFRGAWCVESGAIAMTKEFDDFNDAYDAFVCEMGKLAAFGTDLSTFQWRGVFTPQEIADMLTL